MNVPAVSHRAFYVSEALTSGALLTLQACAQPPTNRTVTRGHHPLPWSAGAREPAASTVRRPAAHGNDSRQPALGRPPRPLPQTAGGGAGRARGAGQRGARACPQAARTAGRTDTAPSGPEPVRSGWRPRCSATPWGSGAGPASAGSPAHETGVPAARRCPQGPRAAGRLVGSVKGRAAGEKRLQPVPRPRSRPRLRWPRHLGTSAGPSVGPGHLERFQVGARSGSCNVHTPGDAGRSGAGPGCPASRVRRRRGPGARVLRAPPGAWRARALSASAVRRDALALAGRACDDGSRSLRRRRSELLPTSHLRGTPGEHLPARSTSLFRSSRFRGDSDTPSQTPGWG